MNRLVLFAHWSPNDDVPPYVLHHLGALRGLGARVAFVSNSPLSGAARAALGPLVHEVRVRENVGFDFAMWQDGLRDADLGAVDELVLTNSSVIGPLVPLAPIFERMDAAGWDFWAMTESGQFRHHLQSFFFVFKPPVFRSDAFRIFFASVLPYRTKVNVIHGYELGLAPFLWEAGFRGGAAFPPGGLPPRRLADLFVRGRLTQASYERRKNPTIYYPDRLLAAGMPYVKMELLRDRRHAARILGIARVAEAFLEGATPAAQAAAAGSGVRDVG